ncbi:MAG: hypothetical protein ACRDNF_17135 [Streptosporangiaceae bacterium]
MESGRIIAGGACGENDCPTITSAEKDMVDVQGYHQPGIATPDGEVVARIPASLILEAARALGR